RRAGTRLSPPAARWARRLRGAGVRARKGPAAPAARGRRRFVEARLRTCVRSGACSGACAPSREARGNFRSERFRAALLVVQGLAPGGRGRRVRNVERVDVEDAGRVRGEVARAGVDGGGGRASAEV